MKLVETQCGVLCNKVAWLITRDSVASYVVTECMYSKKICGGYMIMVSDSTMNCYGKLQCWI